MKIVYRIYNDWNQAQVEYLSQFDIKVELGYDRFDIEDGVLFKMLMPILNSWGASNSVGTFFDDTEINTSKIVVYNGTWSNGYPQPEKDYGYIGSTYDSSCFCKYCGTGLVQREPFRIKKEPLWGKKKVFDLNWVFDEIFVSKESYESIFRCFNIRCKEVMLYKKDTVVLNTLQLDIPTVSIELNLTKQSYELCEQCGIKKFNPQIKGFFPKFLKPVNGIHCFKSIEYFGSGTNAHKKIFMSQELIKSMQEQKIKSQFIPVEN